MGLNLTGSMEWLVPQRPEEGRGEEPGHDEGTEDHQDEGGAAGARQAAGQRVAGVPGDGVQPRQLLPVSGAVREGGRDGAGGDQPEEAGDQEPGGGGGRGGGGGP